MLGTQVALLGVGSAVIKRLPAHPGEPGRLIDAAVTFVAASAAVSGAGFLVLAGSGALPELRAVASDPLYVAIFLGATISGTVAIVFDQTSTALRRGDQALLRGATFGAASIAALVLLSTLGAEGSRAIFAPWLVAGAFVLAVGGVQLRRALPAYRARPSREVAIFGELVRTGLPNHLLTLAERAPGLLLPIFVAELLSPADNAAWYIAWMTAWVVFVVPVQVGMTAFAEAARQPGELAGVVRHGVRTSLVIGVAGAVLAAALAGPLLSLLGETYVDQGREPLRALLLAVVPLSFTFAYYAACRATGRLRQGTATAWAIAVAGTAAAVAAGTAHGLTAMALAWVAVQYLGGAWSAWRLRALVT